MAVPPERVVLILPGRPVASLPAKYDLESLRYRLDWSRCLDGDAIVAADVQVISGTMTADPGQVAPDPEGVVFRLAGGRAGNDATIQCIVDTAAGDTLETVLTCRCLEPASRARTAPPAVGGGVLDGSTADGTGLMVGDGIL